MSQQEQEPLYTPAVEPERVQKHQIPEPIEIPPMPIIRPAKEPPPSPAPSPAPARKAEG
jgi:hypothetical protein